MNRGPLFSAPVVGGHLAPLEIRSAPPLAYRGAPGKVEITSTPCDDRCMYATGPDCSCSCGGVNHGRGNADIGSLFAGLK